LYFVADARAEGFGVLINLCELIPSGRNTNLISLLIWWNDRSSGSNSSSDKLVASTKAISNAVAQMIVSHDFKKFFCSSKLSERDLSVRDSVSRCILAQLKKLNAESAVASDEAEC
jgi:hypothetical protein